MARLSTDDLLNVTQAERRRIEAKFGPPRITGSALKPRLTGPAFAERMVTPPAVDVVGGEAIPIFGPLQAQRIGRTITGLGQVQSREAGDIAARQGAQSRAALPGKVAQGQAFLQKQGIGAIRPSLAGRVGPAAPLPKAQQALIEAEQRRSGRTVSAAKAQRIGAGLGSVAERNKEAARGAAFGRQEQQRLSREAATERARIGAEALSVAEAGKNRRAQIARGGVVASQLDKAARDVEDVQALLTNPDLTEQQKSILNRRLTRAQGRLTALQAESDALAGGPTAPEATPTAIAGAQVAQPAIPTEPTSAADAAGGTPAPQVTPAAQAAAAPAPPPVAAPDSTGIAGRVEDAGELASGLAQSLEEVTTSLGDAFLATGTGQTLLKIREGLKGLARERRGESFDPSQFLDKNGDGRISWQERRYDATIRALKAGAINPKTRREYSPTEIARLKLNKAALEKELGLKQNA